SVGTDGKGTANRPSDLAGDSFPLAIPRECGPRLLDVESFGRHAVGRRGAAHSLGDPGRLPPDRRVVRPGRTEHWTGPAGQRTVVEHAEGNAGFGQHVDRGGAR